MGSVSLRAVKQNGASVPCTDRYIAGGQGWRVLPNRVSPGSQGEGVKPLGYMVRIPTTLMF